MARGSWPCCGSGSRGSGSCYGRSSNGRLYRLVNESDDVPLDDPAPTTPLVDDTNPVAQPDGDAT